MSPTLEAALKRLLTLSEEEQERYASFLLWEMNEDIRWDATTAAHPEAVAKIEAEVKAAFERGECKPLDPKQL